MQPPRIPMRPPVLLGLAAVAVLAVAAAGLDAATADLRECRQKEVEGLVALDHDCTEVNAGSAWMGSLIYTGIGVVTIGAAWRKHLPTAIVGAWLLYLVTWQHTVAYVTRWDGGVTDATWWWGVLPIGFILLAIAQDPARQSRWHYGRLALGVLVAWDTLVTSFAFVALSIAIDGGFSVSARHTMYVAIRAFVFAAAWWPGAPTDLTSRGSAHQEQ